MGKQWHRRNRARRSAGLRCLAAVTVVTTGSAFTGAAAIAAAPSRPAASVRVIVQPADRLHKLTTALVQTHTVLGVETLAVKNMMAAGGAESPCVGEASNRHLLRRLKTVVVSEVEKAHLKRQVGIRKTSVSESLWTCSYFTSGGIETDVCLAVGMSLAGARLLARWCPA